MAQKNKGCGSSLWLIPTGSGGRIKAEGLRRGRAFQNPEGIFRRKYLADHMALNEGQSVCGDLPENKSKE